MKRLLITTRRCGTYLLKHALKFYGIRSVWIGSEAYTNQLTDEILIGHSNYKQIEGILSEDTTSKVVFLMRRDTLRQAFSYWIIKYVGERGVRQNNISNLETKIIIPDTKMSHKICNKILSYQCEIIESEEKCYHIFEKFGINYLTLFYEDNLLGKGECCLEHTIKLICRFYDIPFSRPSNRELLDHITFQKTNLATEILYRKFLTYAKHNGFIPQ